MLKEENLLKQKRKNQKKKDKKKKSKKIEESTDHSADLVNQGASTSAALIDETPENEKTDKNSQKNIKTRNKKKRNQ